MRNLFRYVGLRHLKFRPVRSGLTSFGVALGVALYVAIQIINRSTLDTFRESIESISGKAALSVMAGETGFPEDKLSVIEKVPGVAHAVPMVETRAFFAANKTAETLTILGVDLLKEQSVRTYKTTDEQTIEDPLAFLNQADSVILTHAFAQAHHLKIDDPIEIATSHGKRRLVIRGLLTAEGPAKAYGGALAIMDIDGAQMTFGKEGKLDRVDIVPVAGENPDTVQTRVESALGPGYVVEKPETQVQGMGRMVHSYQTMLSFFSTLALLVGLIFVMNSVSIAVAERRREIGILRAVGATQWGILTLFLSEAAAMGIAGGLGGVFLGRALSSILIGMVTKSISVQYLTPMTVGHLVFGIQDIVGGLSVGVGAAVFGALWPALKSASIKPLEAMRRLEAFQVVRSRYPFTWAMGAGAAMVVYLKISSVYHLTGYSKFLQVLTEIMGIVGPALLGPGLVAILILLFHYVALPLGGPVTRLAQDNLLQNPKRTASNVTTLMVGLILVIIVSALNASFKMTISNWFDRVLKADLLVSSYGALEIYQVQPIKEEIGKELEKVPGVLMGPERGAYGFRFIHVPYGGIQIALKTWDEPNPSDHYRLFDVVDRNVEEAGHDLYHSPDPTVFVSENFVLHFQKKTGDVLDLATPSGNVPFRIAGVITDYSSPEGVLYMDRVNYKKYWKDSLVNAFAISAAPGVDRSKLRHEIDTRFGSTLNLMTVATGEMKEAVNRNIDEGFTYTKAIEGAALLVALLSLLNTFLVSVMERTRELGVLRALGMERRQTMGLIIQEALVQGGFGAVVAVGLGTLIAQMWIKGSLSYEMGWIIHFYFPWNAVATTVLTGVVVTLIAGLYPAWRASHLEIREALEYE